MTEFPSDPDERLVEIPHEQLSPDALRGLLEEYATRGGYDSEVPLEDRLRILRRRLERGEIRLVFDPLEGAANVVERRGAGSPRPPAEP